MGCAVVNRLGGKVCKNSRNYLIGRIRMWNFQTLLGQKFSELSLSNVPESFDSVELRFVLGVADPFQPTTLRIHPFSSSFPIMNRAIVKEDGNLLVLVELVDNLKELNGVGLVHVPVVLNVN